jgi:peptidoglycan/xylan/chitin deacetylase (PgdA/CDA1 family)
MTRFGTWSRETVLHGVWRTRALTLTRRLCADRLVILRYHSVCDDNDQPVYVSRSISVPVTAFDRQMRYLSQHYSCLSLSNAVECLTNGHSLPPRSVVITFDDGYQDNYRYALPVLVKYRVPATIYLVSSTLTEQRILWTSRLRQALAHSHSPELRVPGLSEARFSLRDDTARAASIRALTNILNRTSSDLRHRWIERIAAQVGAPAAPHVGDWFLTPREIEEMKRENIEFGAHSVTHPNLPGIPAEEARSEIRSSRCELQRVVGTEMLHFSYPNSGSLHPHFCEAVVRFVVDAGFKSAVTSHTGMCRRSTDAFRLRRVGINRARSPLPRFSLLLETTRLAWGLSDGAPS